MPPGATTVYAPRLKGSADLQGVGQEAGKEGREHYTRIMNRIPQSLGGLVSSIARHATAYIEQRGKCLSVYVDTDAVGSGVHSMGCSKCGKQ